MLLAIDIMLLMEPKHIESVQKGSEPFALTFFRQRQEKLWRYDVCIVTPGESPSYAPRWKTSVINTA